MNRVLGHTASPSNYPARTNRSRRRAGVLFAIVPPALAVMGCAAGPTGGGGSSTVCTPQSDASACCPAGESPQFITTADDQQQFAGCVPESMNLTDGNVERDGKNALLDGEPNDTFDLAIPAVFDGGRVANLQGSIDVFGDIDVYALGELVVGDRVTADVDGITTNFDVSIALYDEQFRLVRDNDDESFATGNIDAFFVHTIRHGGMPYYLVISHSAFAPFTATRGNYQAIVTLEHGTEVRPPKPQAILLDFDGGPVDADNVLITEVRPFDAGIIHPNYQDANDVIKQLIHETMDENFEGFDVDIYANVDDIPPGTAYSEIKFGSRSSIAFGISESVDHYNADPTDLAIIFTESFTPDNFGFLPTVEELALAIGNIGAHEAGHLLGLNHVDDQRALMDGASPASTFVQDQDFIAAPVSDDIIPIGTQDAVQMLAETVGLRDIGAAARAIARRTTYDPTRRRIVLGPPETWCGTCRKATSKGHVLLDCGR